jgi:ABC-type Fe3+ transport system substrate-binding protein
MIRHTPHSANPIAVLKQSSHPDAAPVWIDYLLTPQGQAVLAKYGFVPAA